LPVGPGVSGSQARASARSAAASDGLVCTPGIRLRASDLMLIVDLPKWPRDNLQITMTTTPATVAQESCTFEPYENVFIGNFLYGLGLALGAKLQGRALPSCVSLLQQTPADQMLGDVLADFAGTVLLYEFKRSHGNERKELSKAEKLRVVLKQSPELDKVSRNVHWYVVSLPGAANAEPRIHLSPYIDLGIKAERRSRSLNQYVNDLAEIIVSKNRTTPGTHLVKEYLRTVAALSDSDQGAVGGMLVAIDGNGAIRYVLVDDIRDLALQHSQHLARESERQQVRQQETEQPSRTPGDERTKSGPTYER
jgi:hypothetical protein